jgi:mannose-6-phosphate isomerase
MGRAMSATRLTTRRIEKPWGRHTLWPGFADATDSPVGEIWFEGPDGADAELLVKYLFTSERLSIQVHPDDVTAHAAGHPRGKDEAWVVLAAEQDATIALGVKESLSNAELRAAALDGSIVDQVDWKPVKAGDVIYSPAGTIHAIGAGLTLIEVQQNLDLTYRLYDYGRPRELHLEAGVAVSNRVPFAPVTTTNTENHRRQILVQGGKFVLERWMGGGTYTLRLPAARPTLFIPVQGSGTLDGQRFEAGECWNMSGDVAFDASTDANFLVAYSGAIPLAKLHI